MAMGEKSVLIVDDEMDMRLFLSTLLESHGYRPDFLLSERKNIDA